MLNTVAFFVSIFTIHKMFSKTHNYIVRQLDSFALCVNSKNKYKNIPK